MPKLVSAFPGEPAYELARAMWMVRHDATAKSFDRMKAAVRQWQVTDAQEIIRILDRHGMTVTNWEDIAGG